jgi:tetratricopeptide (TPR) repeat protein
LSFLYSQIGNREIKHHNYLQANKAYIEALNLEPNNMSFRSAIGICQYNLGNYRTAIAIYDIPEFAETEFDSNYFHVLGLSWCKLGKLRKAEILFQQLQELMPHKTLP